MKEGVPMQIPLVFLDELPHLLGKGSYVLWKTLFFTRTKNSAKIISFYTLVKLYE